MRFVWSGHVWTQEPEACKELLQRDGELLELLQGQQGWSQCQQFKQQQEASQNRKHHPHSEILEQC